MSYLDPSYGLSWLAPVWAQGYAPALLIIVVIWSIFWKGLALWHAGRRGQAWWFVIILLINTAGILEIIYLFAALKLKPSQLFKK